MICFAWFGTTTPPAAAYSTRCYCCLRTMLPRRRAKDMLKLWLDEPTMLQRSVSVTGDKSWGAYGMTIMACFASCMAGSLGSWMELRVPCTK